MLLPYDTIKLAYLSTVLIFWMFK